MSAATSYQAYYTKSEPILNYMASMLDFKPTDTIWEPCGGDGVFIDKILQITPTADISVYEIDPAAISILKEKYKGNVNIHIKATDTLLDENVVNQTVTYDKIIGNPPYGARISCDKKDDLNKLYRNLYTKESYTLFLYACIRCLKENGMLSFIIPDTFLSLHRHFAIRQYILKNTRIKELSMFPSSYFPGVNFGYANLCIITLQKSSDVQNNMANCFHIRHGFRTVEDLAKTKTGISKTITQESVYNNVSSAFFFNSTDRINELINDITIMKIGDVASCVTGFYSGNDKEYLKPLSADMKNARRYVTISPEEIRRTELSIQEKNNGISGSDCFVPIVKGGNSKYIKPDEWYMNWSEKAISEYRNSKKCRFQNSNFYFKKNGIAVPMIRSKSLTASLINGRLFDQSIVGVFPYKEDLTYYLLAFFNSSTCSRLINAINPSTNNSANYIKKIPYLFPSDCLMHKVTQLVEKIIKAIIEKKETTCYENEVDSLFENLYKLE